ncbi:MAG: DUF1653 domain-containing protein [Rhodoferax sp.]|nr:DUF1653 domain-containing protein [Rhodoferax sp.]
MKPTVPPHLQPGANLRHYKGGRYTVVGACVIEATLETGILYQPCQGDSQDILWLRPMSAFDEMVEAADGPMPRFEAI